MRHVERRQRGGTTSTVLSHSGGTTLDDSQSNLSRWLLGCQCPHHLCVGVVNVERAGYASRHGLRANAYHTHIPCCARKYAQLKVHLFFFETLKEDARDRAKCQDA